MLPKKLPKRSVRIGRRFKQKGENKDEGKNPASVIECDQRVLPSPSSLTVEDSTAAQSVKSSGTSSTAESVGNCKSWGEQVQGRISIVEVYKHMGSPPKETWEGKKGVIVTLCRVFANISRNTIKKTLDQYVMSLENNRTFSFDRKKRAYLGEYMIPPGSYYEQLIADSMESGNGMKKTTRLLNYELKKRRKRNCWGINREAVSPSVEASKNKGKKTTPRN